MKIKIMRTITLKVHSFIDIITNSSTEIFIQATDKTIRNIKQLIDTILIIGGSNMKCDDIFDMKLKSQNPYGEDYEEIEEDDDYYSDSYDVVISTKAKIIGKDAETAANILSNLTNLFETGEREC